MRPRTHLSGLLLGTLVVAVLPAAAASAADDGTPSVFRFDGGGDDRAAAMTVDEAGNAYIGGSVDTDGEVTFAVVKLSPSGTAQWTAVYDGSLDGVGGSALDVAVDAAGNVYAAGFINDTNLYPNRDYLVVAFGSDGEQRWAQRFNGPGDGFDRATEIAVDSAGAVYVSGTSYTPSPDFTFDWSTHKYSAAGDLLWEQRHRGNGTQADRVADLMLAPDGNVVVTGVTSADGDDPSDIGTVVYDPDGNVVWERQWSDTDGSDDQPRDMDIDADGRITITGTIGMFPPSPIALRYDSSGTLLQTIPFGGSSVDVGDAGDFVLAGFFPEEPNGRAVAKYDVSGTRTWATPVGLGSDEAFHIMARADSTGAVTAAGTVSNVRTHEDDYLVIRFSPDGQELWRYRFNGPVDGDDRVADLAIYGTDAALVTGTSWNDYTSNGGTRNDIVTLRFDAGDVPALIAPTDLSATGISRSQIQLSWSDNGGTEDGFQIERCQGNRCTDFTQIATVGVNVTSYTDDGLERNTKYSYRVRAFNAGGVSDYSNIATGKTRQR